MLVALSVVSVGYIFVYYDYIIDRIIYVDDMAWSDIVLSVTLILLMLEGTRRVLGPALPHNRIAFGLYGYFFTRIEPIRFIDQLYLSTEGIFGQPLAVSASYVMIFVLFGAFMERTGTGQLFMDFAMGITGHTAGGPGKVSVVSSSLFGTISGSAVANVMVDGPISIPLMKRTGFKAHFAAAVEAVASTGGPDHAADHGGGGFRDGRVPGRELRAGGDLGHHTRDSLLRGVLRGRALRGQAPGAARRPALGASAPGPDAECPRAPVHTRAARSCSSCIQATAPRWLR